MLRLTHRLVDDSNHVMTENRAHMNTRSCLVVSLLDHIYRDRRVLHDISFSVARNQVCGLLGPNGSGKTTLLKSVNGILNRQKGCIRVNGKNISTLDRAAIARIMAVVPQETGMVFSFTVLQMVKTTRVLMHSMHRVKYVCLDQSRF